MKPEAQYSDWKRKNPQVGCVFARLLASHPNRYEQTTFVVKSSDPKRIARSISKRVDLLIDDAKISGLALIFPNISDLKILALALIQLRDYPKWNVTFTPIKCPDDKAYLSVGLSRNIPHSTQVEVPSEALILGPFSEFPNTRRAPVVAMELFVGNPLPLDPKTQEPTQKANLAHIEIAGTPHQTREKMWKASVEGRLKSLGGAEDSRAKAKVAFVIPMEMANQMDLIP